MVRASDVWGVLAALAVILPLGILVRLWLLADASPPAQLAGSMASVAFAVVVGAGVRRLVERRIG